MSERSEIKTTIQQAIDYWSQRVDECGLSVDWSEANTHCWRFGSEKKLQRCHIVPDALGGKDEPANIVLLCSRCHAEGPNVTDPDIMWDWIRAYGIPFYETFWPTMGMREYAFIYHNKFSADLSTLVTRAGYTQESDEFNHIVQETLKSAMDEASRHFGQPYFNTATCAGIFRMTLKQLARTYHIEFPFPQSEQTTQEPEAPWWSNI